MIFGEISFDKTIIMIQLIARIYAVLKKKKKDFVYRPIPEIEK